MIHKILQLGMRIYFPLLFVLVFAGCSSDEPTKAPDDEWEDPLEGLPDKGPIRLDNLEIGQRSRYVYFEATRNLPGGDVSLSYVPDTLVLAITGKESNKWVVREFMTPGSENLAFEDEVVLRHLSVDSDSAYFTKPLNAYVFSWIFLHDARTIPLKPVTDPAPLNPDCLPIFGYESDISVQYTTDYSQLGQTFHHLNDYFDYTEMKTDGHGFMYAYGPTYGLVRWTWVSAWTQDKAEGWDLLPD
jgi:hypothetical protein